MYCCTRIMHFQLKFQYYHPFLIVWFLSGSSQVAEVFHQKKESLPDTKTAQLVPMTIIPLLGVREHCQLTSLRILDSCLYGFYAYRHLSTSKLWEWNSWPPLLRTSPVLLQWVAFSQPAGNNPVWLQLNKRRANVLNYREEQCWGNNASTETLFTQTKSRTPPQTF